MNLDTRQLQGIGMTSQRTRERLVQRLQREGIQNHAVLDAIRDIPRHIFMDEGLASHAYEDTALPIGFGQYISQPYVVARMTEVLLAEGVPQKVLEVGTGSGYQAAILGALVPRVYTVERIRELYLEARRRLQGLRMHNVVLRHGDGSWGWEEKGPYDGIIVTAAPREIPRELLGQLAVGGRLVIPVETPGAGQELTLIRRTATEFEKRVLERVRFVPLRGGAK